MTRRAATYSRYSTDLQNALSIEHPEAMALDYATKNDLQIVTNYTDY